MQQLSDHADRDDLRLLARDALDPINTKLGALIDSPPLAREPLRIKSWLPSPFVPVEQL